MGKNIVTVVALLVSFASFGFAAYSWVAGNQQYYEENRPFIAIANANPDRDTAQVRKFLVVQNLGAGAARMKWLMLHGYDPDGVGIPILDVQTKVAEGLKSLHADDAEFVARVDQIMADYPQFELYYMQDDQRVVNAFFTKYSSGELVIGSQEHDYLYGLSHDVVNEMGFLKTVNIFSGVQVEACYCNVSDLQCWVYYNNFPAPGTSEDEQQCATGQFVGCGGRVEEPVDSCDMGPSASARLDLFSAAQ